MKENNKESVTSRFYTVKESNQKPSGKLQNTVVMDTMPKNQLAVLAEYYTSIVQKQSSSKELKRVKNLDDQRNKMMTRIL